MRTKVCTRCKIEKLIGDFRKRKGYKGGSPAGTPKYWDSVTFLPGSLTYVTYGGSTDLWGTTWTPADINSDGFGFKFDVKNQSGYSSQNAYVENARVTVYFS